MSDDTFQFGLHDKTEVDGPIKVENVSAVEVGETPGPEQLAEPETYEDQPSQTVWLKEGDVFHKEDPDVGLFKVTILKIILVEKNDDSEDDYYKTDVKHEPLLSGSHEVDESKMPVITTQNLRGFAQEALTFEAIGNAGKNPDERDNDVTVDHPASTKEHGAKETDDSTHTED